MGRLRGARRRRGGAARTSNGRTRTRTQFCGRKAKINLDYYLKRHLYHRTGISVGATSASGLLEECPEKKKKKTLKTKLIIIILYTGAAATRSRS